MANDLLRVAGPSLASLVGGIVHDAQTLLEQETALVKREVTDELHKARDAAIALGIGIGITSVGGLLLGLMLVYLLQWASSERLTLWGCYGVVGAALMVVGGGLLFFGKRRAGAVHLMPEQTMTTMKDNVAWIKNQL
jgi:hypothetical protein